MHRIRAEVNFPDDMSGAPSPQHLNRTVPPAGIGFRQDHMRSPQPCEVLPKPPCPAPCAHACEELHSRCTVSLIGIVVSQIISSDSCGCFDCTMVLLACFDRGDSDRYHRPIDFPRGGWCNRAGCSSAQVLLGLYKRTRPSGTYAKEAVMPPQDKFKTPGAIASDVKSNWDRRHFMIGSAIAGLGGAAAAALRDGELGGPAQTFRGAVPWQ